MKKKEKKSVGDWTLTSVTQFGTDNKACSCVASLIPSDVSVIFIKMDNRENWPTKIKV